MKKLALAAAALIASTFGASAADLAARPYTKAPPVVAAVYNWGGFYIGGHVGGSWTNQEWVNTANIATGFGDLAPGNGFRQTGTGVFGGGHLGYNWQAGQFVFGLEGTISGMDNRGTVLNTVFGAGDDVFSWRSDWLATVVGRAGIAVQNNLFYVRGGWAGVNNRLSVSDTVPAFVGSGSDTQWHNGWVVGAGWEYGITANWIVGLEYNYAAFETKNYQLRGTAGPAASYAFDVKPRDIQWAVVRLSYKFGAPVVAKY